ncbi:hypothetical protein I4U23_004372 [Adineta vaga]|nr:hypothetical protein I4U23_004372 [Adineta vaga]
MEQLPPLRILVQPRAMYRVRYRTDMVNQPIRAFRFILGEENINGLAYPTIEIPNEWKDKMQENFYIRLTHVTVPNDQVPERCIHPYNIDVNEDNVIKDPKTNSLYFPVSAIDLENGQKSFRFCLSKLVQSELRNYGPLKLLDSYEIHEQSLVDPSNTKRIIELYQLTHSQIRFSIAAISDHNNQLPITYACSSVYSHVMSGAQVEN